MVKEPVTRRGSKRLPSKDELSIWRDYIETSEILRSRLGSRFQSESGLSPGDYSVMLALSEAEDRRLRSSELAADMGWERGRLSHHLGRMEKRGLIARQRCAEDNRGSWVELTDEGRGAFRRSSVPHLRAVCELFLDALDSEQLEQVRGIAAALRTHLEP